jgi:hypothetical protein
LASIEIAFSWWMAAFNVVTSQRSVWCQSSEVANVEKPQELQNSP